MGKKFNQYLGKAGHLMVMSEFLMRGWNVAIPEVDIGDDIFVVQDNDGTLRRVQVKTATAAGSSGSYSGKFSVALKNLRNITSILVHYIFIVRLEDAWTKPVIIRQDYLLDHFENGGTGSEAKGNIIFYFSYSNGKVSCSGRDFSQYLGDYSDFPLIHH